MLQNLLINLKPFNCKTEKVTLAIPEGYLYNKVIDKIQSYSHRICIQVFISNDKSYIASKTLSKFEDLLLRQYFFCIRHSCHICMHFIMKQTKGEVGFVAVSYQSVLDVSARRINIFFMYKQIEIVHMNYV